MNSERFGFAVLGAWGFGAKIPIQSVLKSLVTEKFFKIIKNLI